VTEPRITIADMRAAKICASGARETARHYGIDWSEFVQHGMTCDDAEATGNAVLIDLAAKARARHQQGS
jgi:hypothetical protein